MRASTIHLYHQYEKLLLQRAWAWNRLTNVPVDELISEAKLKFFQQIKKWNPEKSKLSTWLYITINSHLQNFCHNYHNISPCLEEPVFSTLMANEDVAEDNDDRLTRLMTAIPSEYRDICKKIINEGKEMSKAELTVILRKEGWKWTDIWKFFKEMKKILKNI